MSSNSCNDWPNPFQKGAIRITDFSVSGSEDIADGDTGPTLVDIDAFQRVADSVTVLTASSDFDQIQIVGQNGITVSLSEASSTTAKYTITGQNFLNAGTPSSLVYYNTGTTISATEGVTYDSINSIFNTVKLYATSDTELIAKFQNNNSTNAAIKIQSGGSYDTSTVYFDDGEAGYENTGRGAIIYSHGSSEEFRFNMGGDQRIKFEKLGHITPIGDGTQNLGGTVKRWNDIHAAGSIKVSGSAASFHLTGASDSTLLSIHSATVSNILSVSGSGRIGINTAPDANKYLYVKDPGGQARFSVSGDVFIHGATDLKIQNDNRQLLWTGGSGRINSHASHYLYLQDSNGQSVGIGVPHTSNPSARLHILGTDTDNLFQIDSATNSNLFTVKNDEIGFSKGVDNSVFLSFNKDSSDSTRIGKIHWHPTNASMPRFQISNDVLIYGSSKLRFYSHAGSPEVHGANGALYINTRGSDATHEGIRISGSAAQTILRCESPSNANILKVDGSGYIGVGTTPQVGYRLNVDGDVRVKNSRVLAEEYVWYSNSSQGYIKWNDGQLFNGVTRISASTNARLEVTGSDDSTLFGVHSTTNSNILAVTGSGRIGILTSNPTAALHVAGPAGKVTIGGTSAGSAQLYLSSEGTGERIQAYKSGGGEAFTILADGTIKSSGRNIISGSAARLEITGSDDSVLLGVHSSTTSNVFHVTGSGRVSVNPEQVATNPTAALNVRSLANSNVLALKRSDVAGVSTQFRITADAILNINSAPFVITHDYGESARFYQNGKLRLSSSSSTSSFELTGSDSGTLLGIHSATNSNLLTVPGAGNLTIGAASSLSSRKGSLHLSQVASGGTVESVASNLIVENATGAGMCFLANSSTNQAHYLTFRHGTANGLMMTAGRDSVGSYYGNFRMMSTADQNWLGFEMKGHSLLKLYNTGIMRLSHSAATFEITGSDSDTLFGVRSASKSSILTVAGDGTVGVNNASPGDYWSGANHLVVSGPNHSGITIASNSVNTSGIAFADGTSGAAAYAGVIQYSHSVDAFRFYTNNQLNSPQLYIDSSGNIGINTSTPGKKLSIVASGATEDVVQVQSANGSVCIRDEIYSNNGATRWFNGNSAQHIIGADSTFGGVVFNELGRSDTNFRIETANQSNMFYVNAANDRIGIGTNNPQGMLHLEADATGNDPSYPHILLSDTTPADSREVKIECIAGDYVVEQGTSLTSGTPSIGGKYTLGDGGLHILNGTSLSFKTQTAGHEYFKVTTSGNPGVSIGYATTNTHAVKGSLQSISDASKFTFNTAAGTFKVIDSGANNMLNITSASTASSKRVLLSSTNGAELDIVNYSVNQTAGIHTIKLSTADSAAPHWVIRNNSNADILNINTTLINAAVDAQFAQDVTVYGTLTEASSRKFKEDEKPLGNQLGNIMKLNPVTFTWKPTGVTDIGFIAEDFNDVYPDLTTMEDEQETHIGDDGQPISTYGGIKYSKITSVLTKGMQELYNMVKEQKNEISELNEEILKLKKGK